MFSKPHADAQLLSQTLDFAVYRTGDRVLKIPRRAKAVAYAKQMACASAQIAHPHILPVTWEDNALISSYCPESLAHRAPCAEEEARHVLLTLLGALEALHACGVVGVDLKPSHVLFRDDHLFLIDCFLPHSHSLHWMPPEVAYGEASMPSSDLYAAGALLYYMLTGRHVHDVSSPSALWWRLTQESAPVLPGRFGPFVEQALSSRPEARWASAAEMRDALAAV